MSENDITTEVNTEEKLVQELEKENAARLVGGHKEKSPLADVGTGLNQQLLEMTKRGVNFQSFSGVERCIRILNAGSTSQRHCMAMMVSDNVHGKHCSNCQKTPNPGICNPTVINSSMIKLNDRELKECGLTVDPTYVPPERRTTVPLKVRVAPVTKTRVVQPRRVKVVIPNQVKIEITMKELETSDVVEVLLKKTLEAIYDLPITKFSEAEAIRSTSEKIKSLLKGT